MEDLLWLVSFADDDDRELTTPEVANALGAGQIHLGTLVWRDGMAEWLPLTDLPELGAVVARHRAMSMSLKKRQTVLGGFRAAPVAAAPVAEAPPVEPLPPLAPSPAADPLGLKATHPTGLSNGPRMSLESSPDGEPPTLRQSVPPPVPAGVAFSATATPRQDQSLAGFQPVPNRRGFSRGRSLEGDGLDDDGLTGEAFNRTEEEAYPASIDSEGYLKIPSEELSSVPRVEFEDESTPSEGNSAARLSARQLSWRPDAEPSSPVSARVDALADALQIPRAPRFDAGSDTGDAEVEVLAKRPRVRPPINQNYTGPARTIPPRAGISAVHVETYGAPLAFEPPPAPKRSGTKRWFLGGMAAIALGSVAFLAVHFGDSELDQLTQRATEPSARAPSRTFAAQPATSQLGATPSAAEAAVVAPAQPSAAAAAVADAKPKVNSSPNAASKSGTTQQAKATVNARSLPRESAEASPAASEVAASAADSPEETADGPSARNALVDSKSAAVNGIVPPAASEPGVGAEFDRDAASSALEKAATDASSCRKDGDPSGVARVSITFSDSGRAIRATVDGPPFAGTATGGCIAEVMRRARVPAYAGDHITVKKTVVIQ